VNEACVKGTIFKNVVDEINEQLANGRFERADLAHDCKPEDLAHLDREIAIAAWYPVDVYGRLLRGLCERVGNGDPEFLVESGRRSARRVIEMGIYSQLDSHTERWDRRVGRVLVTLSGAFYNFGEWIWQYQTGGGFRIEVRDVGAMPEEVALRAHGFVDVLTTRAAGRPLRVRYQRPHPALIVFEADAPQPDESAA
jgi:hypothetical protein